MKRTSCLSSSFRSISLERSHLLLSNCFAKAFIYDKNQWKRDRDEPDAPLLLHVRNWSTVLSD